MKMHTPEQEPKGPKEQPLTDDVLHERLNRLERLAAQRHVEEIVSDDILQIRKMIYDEGNSKLMDMPELDDPENRFQEVEGLSDVDPVVGDTIMQRMDTLHARIMEQTERKDY